MSDASHTPPHRRFGPSWYCSVEVAIFEPQEAERNDGNCPYCGKPVGDGNE